VFLNMIAFLYFFFFLYCVSETMLFFAVLKRNLSEKRLHIFPV